MFSKFCHPNITDRICLFHEFQLLNEVSAVVSNPKAPFRLHRQKSSSVGLSEFQTLLPTLEVWAQQFHLLKVNTTYQQASVPTMTNTINIYGKS